MALVGCKGDGVLWPAGATRKGGREAASPLPAANHAGVVARVKLHGGAEGAALDALAEVVLRAVVVVAEDGHEVLGPKGALLRLHAERVRGDGGDPSEGGVEMKGGREEVVDAPHAAPRVEREERILIGLALTTAERATGEHTRGVLTVCTGIKPLQLAPQGNCGRFGTEQGMRGAGTHRASCVVGVGGSEVKGPGLGVPPPLLDGKGVDVVRGKEVVRVVQVHLPDDHRVGHHGNLVVRDASGSPHGAGVLRPREHMEDPDLPVLVTHGSGLCGVAVVGVCRVRGIEVEVAVLHCEVTHRLDCAAGGVAALHGNLGQLFHAHHVVAVGDAVLPARCLGGDRRLSDHELRIVDDAEVLVVVPVGALNLQQETVTKGAVSYCWWCSSCSRRVRKHDEQGRQRH